MSAVTEQQKLIDLFKEFKEAVMGAQWDSERAHCQSICHSLWRAAVTSSGVSHPSTSHTSGIENASGNPRSPDAPGGTCSGTAPILWSS